MPDTLAETPVPTIDQQTTQIVNTVGGEVAKMGESAESVHPAHSVIPGQDTGKLAEQIQTQFEKLPQDAVVISPNETVAPISQIQQDIKDAVQSIPPFSPQTRVGNANEFLKHKIENAKARGMTPEQSSEN